MKEVLAAASSGDGRQEMSMEKKYLNTTARNTFSKKAFVSFSAQCGLEDLIRAMQRKSKEPRFCFLFFFLLFPLFQEVTV